MRKVIIDVELADGQLIEGIRVTNRAMVAWDLERKGKGWPKSADAPHLTLTFLAYEQLRINGQLPEGCDTFAKFRDTYCVDLEDKTAPEGSDDADVDPTPPASEPDSV